MNVENQCLYPELNNSEPWERNPGYEVDFEHSDKVASQLLSFNCARNDRKVYDRFVN